MNKTAGIITNKQRSDLLSDLTKLRSINTVPFGGKYRLIDFALSNMVNSGVNKVGVIGSAKYRALVEHLGTGQEWSLSRKNKGLMILNCQNDFQIENNPKISIKDLIANIAFFEQIDYKNIIIAESDLICKIDYTGLIEEHEKNNADVTIVCKKIGSQELDDDDIKVEIDQNTQDVNKLYSTNEGSKHFFLDMLIVKKDLLFDIVTGCKDMVGPWDLMKIIDKNISQLKVKAYEFNGYFYKVNSIQKYYKCSMELLEKCDEKDLFRGDNKIYTRIYDNHPTKYIKESITKDSVVASGCILKGEIHKSIIFRQVETGEGSKISNSIVMQRCKIGKNVVLDNVIIDKEVYIGDNTVLKGKKDEPIVIGERTKIG